MAGLHFYLQTDELAVPAGAALTIFDIRPPANQKVEAYEISLSFKGVGPVDPPVRCRFRKWASGGTAGSALTLLKRNTKDTEAIQTTAFGVYVGEPTYDPDEPYSEEIHPMDRDRWQAVNGSEILLGGGTRYGMVVFPQVAVTLLARMRCRE